MNYSAEQLYSVIEEIRIQKQYSMQKLSVALGKDSTWYETALKDQKDLGLFEFLNICLEFNVPVYDVLNKVMD